MFTIPAAKSNSKYDNGQLSPLRVLLRELIRLKDDGKFDGPAKEYVDLRDKLTQLQGLLGAGPVVVKDHDGAAVRLLEILNRVGHNPVRVAAIDRGTAPQMDP